MGAIHAGGIIAGIYTTNSAEACLHVMENSRTQIVVVDEAKQMDKIKEIRDKLPHLKAAIQIQEPYAPYMKKEDGYYRVSALKVASNYTNFINVSLCSGPKSRRWLLRMLKMSTRGVWRISPSTNAAVWYTL